MSNDTGSTPQVPTAPTITAYQELADQFTKQVDAMTAAIPGLQVKHPSTARFVRTHVNIPAEFMATTTAAVEQMPALQATFDAAAQRNDLQYIEAFKQLQNKVSALNDALRYTLRTKHASLGNTCLQAYAIAKGIARIPGDAVTLTHVANMKKDLARKRRTNSTPQQQPQSQQTPEPRANAAQA